jgi:hypothetical protein
MNEPQGGPMAREGDRLGLRGPNLPPRSSNGTKDGPDPEQLWRRIASLEIGPPHAAPDFVSRLTRENGWSKPFAGVRRRCLIADPAATP